MLRLLITLLTLLHISTASSNCDACLNNVCHRKISVLEGYTQFGQIAIDRTSNIFYFHVKDDLKSFTCAYDLNRVRLDRIWDVDFSFARAVDEKTRDLYLSRESSVFKVNPEEFYADGVTVFNASVWHMQFKDKLYYSEFGSTGLKTYEDGEHKDLDALKNYQIDDFIVDKNNDIYFSSNYAVNVLKNGRDAAELFADEIYTLSTDKNGEAYFIQPFNKGLYKVDYKKDAMVEIGAVGVGTPYKMVFTSENYMIYTDIDVNGIYYLLPSKSKCKVARTLGDKGKPVIYVEL